MRTENQARVIVVIEWVFFGFAVLLVTLFGIGYTQMVMGMIGDQDSNMDERAKLIIKIVFAVLFVLLSFNLFLNILLTKGVHQEKSTACKVWYIINIVFMGFYILDLAVAIITFNIIALIIQGPIFAYRVYAIMTIMKFTEELIRPNVNNMNGVVYMSPTVATGAPDYPNTNPPPYYFEKGQGPGEGQVTVNLV